MIHEQEGQRHRFSSLVGDAVYLAGHYFPVEVGFEVGKERLVSSPATADDHSVETVFGQDETLVAVGDRIGGEC